MPSKLAVAVLALIIHLPLIETILYYTLLHRQPPVRLRDIWSQAAAGLLIGWLLVLPSLLVTRQMLKAALARTRDWLAAKLGDRIRKYWTSGTLLMLIPSLLLLMVLLRPASKFFWDVAKSKIVEAATMILLWGLVVLLSWLVNWLFQHVRYTTSPDVSGALDDWMVSVRMSVPYYLFALGFAWYIGRPSTVSSEHQSVAYFSFAKDVVLIWVIGQILFVSVFHLKRAGKLLALFRSLEGYLRFLLTCAVVALIAIAADFHYLVSAQALRLYPEDWQQNLMVRHTFIRDIGLLLLPIAGLLIWALRAVGAEASAESRSAPAMGS